MSHLDEGHLHALLDGELDEPERQAAEAHLAACADCRREYDEAKALLGSADELIAAVELPRATQANPGTRRATGASPGVGRQFNWRAVAWAASVVLAVGLGWLARAERGVQGPADSYGKVATQPDGAPAPETRAPSADRAEPPEERGRVEGGRAPGLIAQAPQPKRENLAPEPGAAPAKPPVPIAPAAPAPRQQAAGELAKSEPAPRDAVEKPAAVADLAEQARGVPTVAAAQGNAPAAAALAGKSALTLEAERKPSDPLEARKNRPVGGFQPMEMEGAVRILGGSIRLLNGLTPTQVLVGRGTLVPAADPRLEVVRVVYMDPPGRELWLDQQRPGDRADEADAQALSARGATTLLPGDTVVTPVTGGARSLAWIDQSGFRVALTGFLPADSLRALARQVQ